MAVLEPIAITNNILHKYISCLNASSDLKAAFKPSIEYNLARVEEHFDKIEAITNLPNVSNYIVVGPIRDFDRTSLNDFKNIYQNICNRVRGIYNQNYSRHSSELTARMIELDSKIARKHNDDELKINSIKVLIKSLENKD